MNSKIKSLTETSNEVRDFELRDVTELGIWLPAIRVEGLLTGYFTNYVGDSDGLFIVLDSEPGKAYHIDNLDALKDIIAGEARVDIDFLVLGVESSVEWRQVEGTETWVIVEEPWKLIYDYAEKMKALNHTRTQSLELL